MKKLVLITMIALMTFTALASQSFAANDKANDCPTATSCVKRCDDNSNNGISDDQLSDSWPQNDDDSWFYDRSVFDD